MVINLPSSVQHCFTLALPSRISFTLIFLCSALFRACLVMHCSTCFLHLQTLLSLRVCHLRRSLSEFIFLTPVQYGSYTQNIHQTCVVFSSSFFILCTNFSASSCPANHKPYTSLTHPHLPTKQRQPHPAHTFSAETLPQHSPQ